MIRLLALLALSAALLACKTAEQKLVDRRRELRDTLDRTYAEYSAARPREEGGDSGLLGQFASQVDRAYFESQCLALGRGERGFALSPRLDAFLGEKRNVKACRKAADLQIEVAELEREVSPERQP